MYYQYLLIQKYCMLQISMYWYTISIYNGLIQTTWIEAIAVFAGIASVWYSRKENILVYPVGIINTTFYIYLSFKGHLFGEASVNLYYTTLQRKALCCYSRMLC